MIIPEWKRVIRHAWSVRFAALSVVCEGISVAWPYFEGYLPITSIYFGVLGGIFAAAALASRFLYQVEMHDD